MLGGAPDEMVATLPLVPSTFFRARVEVLYFQEGHVMPIEIFALSAPPQDSSSGSNMEGGFRNGPGVGSRLMTVAGYLRYWVLKNRAELTGKLGLPNFKLDLEDFSLLQQGQQGEGAGGALTVWVSAPDGDFVSLDHDGVAGAMLVGLLALATGLQLPTGEHETALGMAYFCPLSARVHGYDMPDEELATLVAKPSAVSVFQSEEVRRLLLPAPPKKVGLNANDEEGEDGWSGVVAKAAEVQVQAVRPPTNDVMAYLRAALGTSASANQGQPGARAGSP